MYRFILPLALAAAVPAAMAQTAPAASGPLTLAMAVKLAFGANPALAAARHEVQALEGGVLQAGLRPNPSLDLNLTDARKATRETTVQLNQPIELGGKRARRMQAADQAREAAVLDLAVKKAQLWADVSTAFYDALLAQARVKLAQESVDNARGAAAAAAKRASAGKISPVEERRARVAEASVGLELVQAGAGLTAARNRLSLQWGGSRAGFGDVVGELDAMPAVPAYADLEARLAVAPALQRARTEVALREAMAQVERSKQVPDLGLTLGMKRAQEQGRNQAIFGVSVPLALFDRNQGNVLETARRVDQARDQLTAVQTGLNTELMQAHAALVTAREMVQTLRGDILPGARGAFEAARTGFEFGKFSLLDVLDAQRTLLQTKSQYLQALADMHRADADLVRLTGVPTSTKIGE